MGKKYELTDQTIKFCGSTLRRIRALKSFGHAEADALGGYIERESNLNQEGDAWVEDDAYVFGNARVSGDALVSGDARVFGKAWISSEAWVSGKARVCGEAWVFDNAMVFSNARVYGDANVSGNAKVYGDAWVYGNANVSGNARISGEAKLSDDAYIFGDEDHCTVGPIGSRDDYTTFYRRRDGETMVVCGCFHDTIDAFESRVHKVHAGTPHEAAYLAAIALARARIRKGAPAVTNAEAEEQTQ